MSAEATKRNACPGPWTPMAAGDGLLIRLRGSSHSLTATQVRGLAALASEHGSGLIELTRRANLQLRGLCGETLAELQAGLVKLGLADPSPAREQRPGLLVDPLHGLVPGRASLDQLAHAIDGALAACTEEHALSAKLGIVLDNASGALHDVEADIRVELLDEVADRAQVLVPTPTGAVPLAVCRAADIPEAVSALLRELARCCDPDGSRMRDLVRAQGLDALRACVAHLALADVTVCARARSLQPALPTLGFQGGVTPWLGLGIAFGSAPSATWMALAELAERFGQADVRLSPAREVILPGVRLEIAVPAVMEVAREHGLITREDDSRRRVIACSGAPACVSSLGETRALATALAETARERLAAGGTLHVSGCGKACASGAAATLTVVLAEGGAHLGENATVAAACATAREPLTSVRRRLERLCSEHPDPQAASR